jgi:hypothetical protein
MDFGLSNGKAKKGFFTLQKKKKKKKKKVCFRDLGERKAIWANQFSSE